MGRAERVCLSPKVADNQNPRCAQGQETNGRPIQSKEESLNRPSRANLKNKQTKDQEVKIESQRTKKEVTEIKMRRSKNWTRADFCAFIGDSVVLNGWGSRHMWAIIGQDLRDFNA